VARRGWKIWKPLTHPKAWPVESFRALEAELHLAMPRLRLVLTGSTGERVLGRRLLDTAPHTIDLIGKTSVLELAALLGRLRLFVTADTGPLHVACAVGIPIVALFGGTPVSRFGPWPPRGDRIVVELDPVAAIPVPQVRDAVLAQLEAAASIAQSDVAGVSLAGASAGGGESDGATFGRSARRFPSGA
jgi:ADP-heptose:LPS heptosyltransferase